MVPWIPALAAHTGGKPWDYKTSDGKIVRRGAKGKAGEGQAEPEAAADAEQQAEAKAGESGEADLLDDDMAPKKPKKPKATKPPKAAKPPRESALSDQQHAAIDEQPVDQAEAADDAKPLAARSSRTSTRGRGGTQPALDESALDSNHEQSAATDGNADEAAAESEAAAGGGDELDDFDTALERKKSAYATNKAGSTPTTPTNTEQPSVLESQNTDAAPTPTPTEEPAAAPAAAEAVAAANVDAPAAEPAVSTTEGEEELTTVAGVLPPSSPEPRRSKNPPLDSADNITPKDGEAVAAIDEPAVAEPVADTTPTTTTSGETEPLIELPAATVVEEPQPAVQATEPAASHGTPVPDEIAAGGNDAASVGDVVGEPQQPQAAEAQVAAVPGDTQPAASAEPNDALPVAGSDSPVVASSEQTLEAAGAVVDPAVPTQASDANSANTDGQTPADINEPTRAATDDLTIAQQSPNSDPSLPTTATATVVAPPDELGVASADPAPVVAAEDLSPVVPPVERPTPRRIDLPADDSSLLVSQQGAEAASQPVGDVTPADAPIHVPQQAADAAPADGEAIPLTSPADAPSVGEATPIAAPVSPIESLPGETSVDGQVALDPATTDVGTTPTPATESPVTEPFTDPAIAPASVPVSEPIVDGDAAAAAAAAAAAVSPLTDSNDAQLPVDTLPDSSTSAFTEGGTITDTDPPTEADLLPIVTGDVPGTLDVDGDDVDGSAWKRSTTSSTTSFLQRSFTAGFVLCVAVGCVAMIGKKVKETLDSHEDEGSESLLGKMESGQGASGMLSTGVMSELGGGAGKRDEHDGRAARMKPAIVEEESEEDRYQQQQNKLRSSLGQATSRGMSLHKQPHPPPASKKPTLAVQQVDDEEDTELEEDDEEGAEVQAEEKDHPPGGAPVNGSGGDGRRPEKKSSDEGWESFDNDWDD